MKQDSKRSSGERSEAAVATKSVKKHIRQDNLRKCLSLSLKLCVGFRKLAKVKSLSNGIFGCVFFAHEEEDRFFSL